MTGGRGDYTMQLLRYEEVPAHVAQAVIARGAERAGDGQGMTACGADGDPDRISIRTRCQPDRLNDAGGVRRQVEHAAAERAAVVHPHLTR